MEKKVRQHYVWQRYLQNWSKNQSQIYCLRDNRIFLSGTTCLAVEKYFYKLDEITLPDLNLIEHGYLQEIKGPAKEHAEKIVVMFRKIIETRDSLLDNLPNSSLLKYAFCVPLTNFEENYHAYIEGNSSVYLKSLVNKQTSFYKDIEDNAKFNLYLTTQYVRTKNIQKAIFDRVENHPSLIEPTRRSISVYRFIIAHVFAMGLSHNIDKCSFKVLCNNTEVPFITGDQPVINTKADDTDPTTGYAKALELYYPISPEIAILINPNFGTNQHQEVQVTNDEAKEYNDKMFNASHEQIFAKEEVHLLPYKDT